MFNEKDIVGKKFGMLTVLNVSGRRGEYQRWYYDCICECGEKKLAARNHLMNSNYKISCGCNAKMIREKLRETFWRRRA